MNYIDSRMVDKIKRPIKVIQFGQGNFIRGFADFTAKPFLLKIQRKEVIFWTIWLISLSRSLS